jgi:uncharacterized membrane protein
MTSPRSSLTVGLVAPPTLDEAALNLLARELEERLSERYPDVDWQVVAAREALVDGPADLPDLVDAARTRMMDEDWDLTVAVTDLPLRLNRRPVMTHASRSHNVALVSLPAIGLLRRHRRLLDSIADALAVLIGDVPSERDAQGRLRRGVRTRLIELGTDIKNPEQPLGIVFLARVITGNLRLLLGMIAANRPWRMIPRLSRAMLGAVGVGVAGLLDSDVWKIATALDAWRLAALMVISVVVAVVALIAVHDLWERAPDPRVREQAVLFNLVTTITVAIGIGSLYAGLFVVSLGTAGLTIDQTLLDDALSAPAGFDDYLRLAWLTASLATVGGALGGAVESDTAVREAAYARRGPA